MFDLQKKIEGKNCANLSAILCMFLWAPKRKKMVEPGKMAAEFP
jgi:hypothetical protein